MTLGPVPSRTWEESSATVVSRRLCRPFGFAECPRWLSVRRAGLAWEKVGLVIV
jgi:hypothetical protein